MGPNRFLAGLVAVNAAVGAISAARTAVAKQQGDAILGSVMSWPLIATFAASMALFIVAAALRRFAGARASLRERISSGVVQRSGPQEN